MRPPPWSYSSLGDFDNCEVMYYEKRIAKSVTQEETDEMAEGTRVHKAFELRQLYGATAQQLPPNLAQFETFMLELDGRKGEYFSAEQKIAFDRNGQPCNWQVPGVWYRGVIDWQTVVNRTLARLIDYKTGKPHEKWEQLAIFAIHTFAMFPEVETVEASFFWTKGHTETKRTWTRADIPRLWGMYIVKLRRYKEAHVNEDWKLKRSGLCNGWCPVTSCEFWRPKKGERFPKGVVPILPANGPLVRAGANA